tara:strand:- start:193 stop:633 length:441 start_codon:yes stop_codon:yes gene_type:complete
MLLEEIKEKLKEAMKNSDKSTVLAIRNILEKIKKIQVDTGKELNESEIINVINKYAKQLKDSIDQFQKGGRTDLVEKETDELKIIQQFLPEQLSKEELDIIVQNTIKELGAIDLSKMGLVMKTVLDKTAGQADGKLISQLVREKLS